MTSPPGLRERKKQKTRWTIQEHAIRLFQEQGYEQTTVDQIAAAAEVSSSTFFRYFKTKEDVIIEDEFDPLLTGVLEGAPADLGPIAAVRYAMATVLGAIGPHDEAKLLARTRLLRTVPALRARMYDSFALNIGLLSGPIAVRLGRDQDDFEVIVLSGAIMGALLGAIYSWCDADGAERLLDVLDRSIGVLEHPPG